MAANRVESNLIGEPAAAPAPTAGPAPGGIKAWLPLVVTMLAMPLLAYGMTQFVLLPKLQKGLGITAPAKASPHASVKAQKQSLPMTKLLVNVAGTMGARYLLVSLSAVGSDPDFKNKIETDEPRLRDLACGVLATKTLADLEKPGARNVIRSELISGFNNILGGAVVEEIYLTEFAIQ
ncbi:MAG TPA: flagellar basal body-associated FliL family protein [Clostridia bacterium]|nr:flagellar basal body-associated FliL family protein [Clostridia bacterium]